MLSADSFLLFKKLSKMKRDFKRLFLQESSVESSLCCASQNVVLRSVERGLKAIGSVWCMSRCGGSNFSEERRAL